MPRQAKKQRSLAMYEAIVKIESVEECCRFFDDLCAVTELRAMEQRFDVAKLLCQDKVYTEIMETTNASSATISRVNRMLNYGTGCLEASIEAQLKEEAAADDPQSQEDAAESKDAE